MLGLKKKAGGLGFGHREISGLWFTTRIFLSLLNWFRADTSESPRIISNFRMWGGEPLFP